MVQIIPQTPGLGELIGGGLGKGFATGLSTALSDIKKQRNDQLKQTNTLNEKLRKDHENIRIDLQKELKDLGLRDMKEMRPETMIELGDKATQLSQLTGSPKLAKELVLREYAGALKEGTVDNILKEMVPESIEGKIAKYQAEKEGKGFTPNPTEIDQMELQAQDQQQQRKPPMTLSDLLFGEGLDRAKQFFTPKREREPLKESFKKALKLTPEFVQTISPGGLGSDLIGKKEISKGVEDSAIGEVWSAVTGKPLKKEKDDKFSDSKLESMYRTVIKSTSGAVADMPIMIPAFALGMSLTGNPVAAAAIAMALPAFIKSTAGEYRDYKQNGGEDTFEDFFKRAARVALDTGQAGVLGGVFGLVEKLMPVLKSVPGLKQLMNYKAGETAVKIGAATAAGTAAETVLTGELPTLNSVIGTLATITGLETASMPSQKAKNITERVRRSGRPTEQVAEEIKTRAAEEGIDIEKVNAGDKAEARKLDRLVTDITKKPTKEAKRAEREYKKSEKLPTPEAQEAKIESEKALAKVVSKSPLEDYIETEAKQRAKDNNPSEKEQLRRDEVSERIDTKKSELSSLEDDYISLKKSLREAKTDAEQSKIKKKMGEVYLNTRKGFKELSDLKHELRFGKARYTQEELSKAIEKHLDNLKEAVANPEGKNAEKMNKGFERDQKIVEQAEKLAERGLLKPENIDEYITINEAYNNAYREMIDKLQKVVDSQKGSRSKEAIQNRKTLEALKKNKAISDAKLVKGKDRAKFKEKVSQPGKTFFKNYLKGLRSDIKAFQKDYFTYKKTLKSAEARKAKQLGKEYFKDVNTLDEAVKKFDIPKEEAAKAKETVEKLDDIIKEGDSKTKETVGKKKETKFGQIRKSLTRELKNQIKNLPEHVAKGLLWGVATEYINRFIDDRAVKNSVRSTIGVFLGAKRRGIQLGIASIVVLITDYLEKGYWSAKLNRARKTSKKAETDVLMDIRKKFEGKRRDSILKDSM